MSAVIVTTTVDSERAAQTLATVLLEQRLAACVQVSGPISSSYRWDGQVQTEPEWEISIKTNAGRLDDLTAWLLDNHPYEVPQVLATPVIGGSPAYLEWIDTETTTGPGAH